jgi:hypothetical protein
MRIGFNVKRLLLVAATIVLACQWIGAQTYSSGQNISPAYEGWEKNPDGSFNFLFGYMNRNWEEEIDVPIGPDNNIQPAGPDQGQPTHFLPRRNRYMFRVRVPADFGDKEMVWTLTTHGKQEKAYASFRTDLFTDDVVIASETGSLGAGASSPEIRANKRPETKIEGEKTRTAKVGVPLTITAVVTDDGIPRRRGFGGGAGGGAGGGGGGGRGGGGRGGGAVTSTDASGAAPVAPVTTTAGAGAGRGAAAAAAAAGGAGRGAFSPPSRVTVGKVNGLHLSWFVYRGPNAVTFDPLQVKVWEDTRAGANSPWAPLWQPPVMPADGRMVTQMTFSEPGSYVLRARADDGALFGDDDLKVTVTK